MYTYIYIVHIYIYVHISSHLHHHLRRHRGPRTCLSSWPSTQHLQQWVKSVVVASLQRFMSWAGCDVHRIWSTKQHVKIGNANNFYVRIMRMWTIVRKIFWFCQWSSCQKWELCYLFIDYIYIYWNIEGWLSKWWCINIYIYKGVRPTKMLTWKTEIEISPTEMWIFDTKKYPKMLFGGFLEWGTLSHHPSDWPTQKIGDVWTNYGDLSKF